MRKALVVGINNYPEIPLKGSHNDANAIASILEANGDGSPDFDVKKLLDVGSKGELKGLVSDLFSGEADASLLFFSGHGYIDDLGGCLVTPDYSEHDYGVSMDDVLTMANKSHVKNRIVILDCCHSGAFGSPSCTGSSTTQISEGVTILTASRRDENSMEVGGLGVFTNLLLSALNGGAADIGGYITAGGVYSYIDKALGPWEQRPVFKTNVSRFFPLRTIAPRVPREKLRKLIEYFPNSGDVFSLDPSYEFTNTPDYRGKLIEPYANPAHVAVLKDLQMFESVGLLVPVGADHMYFAAIDSKGCKLTALGCHYWRLANKKLI